MFYVTGRVQSEETDFEDKIDRTDNSESRAEMQTTAVDRTICLINTSKNTTAVHFTGGMSFILTKSEQPIFLDICLYCIRIKLRCACGGCAINVVRILRKFVHAVCNEFVLHGMLSWWS